MVVLIQKWNEGDQKKLEALCSPETPWQAHVYLMRLEKGEKGDSEAKLDIQMCSLWCLWPHRYMWCRLLLNAATPSESGLSDTFKVVRTLGLQCCWNKLAVHMNYECIIGRNKMLDSKKPSQWWSRHSEGFGIFGWWMRSPCTVDATSLRFSLVGWTDSTQSNFKVFPKFSVLQNF